MTDETIDEEAYEAEADYFEEDEEYDDEVEDEEEDAEAEEDEEPEIDYEAEIDAHELQPVVQKINELDNNHRIIKIRPKVQYQSSHIIQFSEMVEAIGIRVSQIEMGSPIFTDVSGYTSSIDMAK